MYSYDQACRLCDQPDGQKVEFCDQISRADRLIRAKGKYRHSSAQPLDHGGRNNDFPSEYSKPFFVMTQIRIKAMMLILNH